MLLGLVRHEKEKLLASRFYVTNVNNKTNERKETTKQDKTILSTLPFRLHVVLSQV